jgi:hypothetical protein
MGGMLYVSSRSESLMMFHWFNAAGCRDEVQAFRSSVGDYLPALPPWVYFSLPQALWYCSGLLLFEYVWGTGAATRHQHRAWTVTFSIIALGGELGQYFRWVPGRFDMLDLILLIVAWSVVGISGSLESPAITPWRVPTC